MIEYLIFGLTLGLLCLGWAIIQKHRLGTWDTELLMLLVFTIAWPLLAVGVIWKTFRRSIGKRLSVETIGYMALGAFMLVAIVGLIILTIELP